MGNSESVTYTTDRYIIE